LAREGSNGSRHAEAEHFWDVCREFVHVQKEGGQDYGVPTVLLIGGQSETWLPGVAKVSGQPVLRGRSKCSTWWPRVRRMTKAHELSSSRRQRSRLTSPERWPARARDRVQLVVLVHRSGLV